MYRQTNKQMKQTPHNFKLSFDTTSFDRKSIGQMTFSRMSLVKMSVGRISNVTVGWGGGNKVRRREGRSWLSAVRPNDFRPNVAAPEKMIRAFPGRWARPPPRRRPGPLWSWFRCRGRKWSSPRTASTCWRPRPGARSRERTWTVVIKLFTSVIWELS